MKKNLRLTIISLYIFYFLFAVTATQGVEPIKIGAFFSLSGPAASIGTPTKLVAEMVVDKINREGGINGRPIQLITGDAESDPTKALIVAKRLVEVEKVVALIGPDRTDLGMAVKPYIEKVEVPTVMTIGGDPIIVVPTWRWVFKSPQRTTTAVAKVYEYLKTEGLKKIALMTASDGFGKEGRKSLMELAPEYGLSIVADESFEPKDTDMTPQLTKIKATAGEVIVVWTIGPAGPIIAKNVKQLGIKIPLIQCHGQPDPKFIELAGEAANGVIMPSTKLMVADQLPENDPQKKLILEFIDLYNNVYGYNRKYPINTHSGYAWDAIAIVVNAMRKVGADKYRLRDAIEQTSGYIGISGIYDITPKDHNGLGLDSLVMVKIEDGKWKLLR